MTRYAPRKGPEERRRDKDREQVKDFFGADDPLVTKAALEKPEDSSPEPAADPDKTIKVDRDEEEHGQVPARDHGSDDFLTTTNFNKDVLLKALQRYADENDFKVEEEPLGAGLYSVAYLAYGAEGDQVLKITAHKKEKDAYQAIMVRRNAAVSEMPNAAKALPRVYDIEQVSTEPVKLRPPPSAEFPGHVPQGEWAYEPAADGKPYDLWIIRMEKLETLEEAGYGEDLRSDIFGYSGARSASPQAMLRYVKNVFSFKNFYNSLEDTLEPDTFERLLSADRATPLGRGKSIMTRLEKGLAQLQQSLADRIKKGTVIPPGAELKKGEENAEWALVVDESKPPILLTQLLNSGFNVMTDELVKLVKTVLGNEELAEDLYFYARGPLHNKMKAAVKIPQYDPETEYGSAVYQAHAGSVTAPPKGKDLESQVAQTFLTRLRELNKLGQATDNRDLEMSYGDLHGGNVMVRENGELVAADVGLFLVHRDPSSGVLMPKTALQENFKRMAELAGIILK